MSFVDEFLAGRVTADGIDDYVEEWHNGAGGGQELHEHLGLTWDEYRAWVAEPDSLTVEGLRADRDLRG